MEGARTVRAPRGTELLLLVVGRRGRPAHAAQQPRPGGRRAARTTWSSTAATDARRAAGRRSTPSCESLREMAPDDTLLVQSGKPVGVMRTHERAPRVLIANSLLVPKWATPEYFRELEDLGLIMYGQMTAGSWIYIGTQGILQGTFATFAEVANQHFRAAHATLAGTITLTGGLGGMGGAQPLAVTGNGGVALCVEVDPWRLQRRIEHRYLDEQADDLDDAIARCEAAKRERRPLSVGLVGQLRRRAARARAPRLDARHRHRPDVGARRAQRLRAERHDAGRGPRAAHGVKPDEYVERSSACDGRALPGDARLPDRRRRGVRLRERSARPGAGRRCRPTPSTTRASSSPTSGHCSPGAPARSAGRACPAATPTCAATDDAVAQRLPRRRRPAALAPLRAREGALPGPALADLLARLRRTSSGRVWRSTTSSPRGAVSAPDRDRPRPPRRRQRRLTRA